MVKSYYDCKGLGRTFAIRVNSMLTTMPTLAYDDLSI